MTIRMTVEIAMPTGFTIAPNSTTLPSTRSVGRHFHGGIASPFSRNARCAMSPPNTINRMPRMRGKYPGPMRAAVPMVYLVP